MSCKNIFIYGLNIDHLSYDLSNKVDSLAVREAFKDVGAFTDVVIFSKVYVLLHTFESGSILTSAVGFASRHHFVIAGKEVSCL